MGKITDALAKVENERQTGRDTAEQVIPRSVPAKTEPTNTEPPKTKKRATDPFLLWGALILVGGFLLLSVFGRVGERSSNVPPPPLPSVELSEPESTSAKEEAIGTTIYANIEIIGDTQFVDEVKAALKLLKKKAKRNFSLVKKQIGKIEKSQQDFRNFKKTPAVVGLSAETALRSTTWLAASIAESACYSKEYHQPSPFFGFWKQEPDKVCSRYKLEVMQRIGAPRQEIDVP